MITPELPSMREGGLTLAHYEIMPLLNLEIADELFGPDSPYADEDMVEMREILWNGVRADLSKDLENLLVLMATAGQEKEAAEWAHRVAGYCGNAGLHRMGVVLRDIQKSRVAGADLPLVLERLADWAQESLSAMRQRYPELAG